ncbi:MAG: hypothetical protein IT577_23870 [Verrucomicrobiae bacterium]|nr:hypothetical protein [Verrucomicrobiae bacterium]
MPPTPIEKSRAVIESGKYRSLAEAGRALGVGSAALARWAEEHGERGAGHGPAGERRGRPSRFALSAEEADALRAHVLRRDSLVVALEDFLSDPACGPGTRALVVAEFEAAARERRKTRWPASLRRAAHVSDELRARFRGPRAAAEAGIGDRRGLTWIDESGVERALLPQVLWESDDMSVNEPYSFADPDTGAPRVARQMLATMDVYSAAWLGATPVGRGRDAYRAEDILDHMLACVDAHGLPVAWRLERGRWENNAIDGVLLPDGTRWGGLGEIVHIIRAWTSGQKGGIESGFHLLQRLTAHDSLSVGRERGEFEAANPVWRLASKGDESAAARFWNIARCADGVAAAMARFNARAKERRAFGRETVVPDDLYRGFSRVDLPADERWRFLPAKLAATVRAGHVETSIKSYPLAFRFRANGEIEGVHLDNGYPVLIAFHPGRPEEGCHLFNGAATTDSRNREAWPVGHRIGLIPLAPNAPQFAIAPMPREATAHRRRANAAVRTEFRAIVAGGRDARRHSVSRDSWGTRAESDTAPAPGGQADITPIRGRAARAVLIGADEDFLEREASLGEDEDARRGQMLMAESNNERQ